MVTVSLCMIVKNEEEVLDRCLASVADLVEEVNIVDTGSTDNTKQIAQKYGCRIFDFKWIDDFAAARNYSFAQATKDYILWLDADDILLEEDRQKFKALKEKIKVDLDGFTFNYHYAVDENDKPTFTFRRERLVRRDKGFKWVGFIHEYIGGPSRIKDEDIAVTHKRIHGSPDRNLRIYQQKLKEGVVLNLRDRYYYGKELYYHNIYDEAIKWLEPLLEEPIWVEEKIDSVCKLADCYVMKQDEEKARSTLMKAFAWTTPRAEVIYKLGQSYERSGKLQEAVYWYRSIEGATIPKCASGFTYLDMWTWRPYLQLSVCYSYLKDLDTAFAYHKKARALKPDDSYIKHNDAYFKSLGFKD